MIYKGIILEIKKDHIVVLNQDGGVFKIRKKPGAAKGDKIFFAEEDIIMEKNKTAGDFAGTKIIAIAAEVLLCIGIVGYTQYNNMAYATVSMDGNQSIQMELNRKGEVIKIVSYGRELTDAELAEFEDLTIAEIWEELLDDDLTKDNPMVIAYAALRGGNETNAQLLTNFKKDIVDKNVIFVKGAKQDVDGAKAANVSLGEYILTHGDEEALEEFLEDTPKATVDKLLEKHKGRLSTNQINRINRERAEVAREREEERLDDERERYEDAREHNRHNHNNKHYQNRYDDNDKDEIYEDDDVDDVDEVKHTHGHKKTANTHHHKEHDDDNKDDDDDSDS